MFLMLKILVALGLLWSVVWLALGSSSPSPATKAQEDAQYRRFAFHLALAVLCGITLLAIARR
jgi:hypothetical protein